MQMLWREAATPPATPLQASTSTDGLVNGDRAALVESIAHVGVTIMSESGHAGRAQRPLLAPSPRAAASSPAHGQGKTAFAS